MKTTTMKRLAAVPVALLAMLVMSAFTAGDTRTFTKTKNKCTKCSCAGYYGYKHQNGTYEGGCQHNDQYGNRCGHGPEKHGLKKW